MIKCIFTQDFSEEKPKDFPPPSARTEESVSESASGTCSRILAWEQISCSCVYLVLTVHTGLFSTAPGCISTHSFPFSEGGSISATRLKNVKVFHLFQFNLKRQIVQYIHMYIYVYYISWTRVYCGRSICQTPPSEPKESSRLQNLHFILLSCRCLIKGLTHGNLVVFRWLDYPQKSTRSCFCLHMFSSLENR